MTDLLTTIKEATQLVMQKHQAGKHPQRRHTPTSYSQAAAAVRAGADHVNEVNSALGMDMDLEGEPTFGDGLWRIRGSVPVPDVDMDEYDEYAPDVYGDTHEAIQFSLDRHGYRLIKEAESMDDSAVWEKGNTQIAVAEMTSNVGPTGDAFYVLATVLEGN
jgi:hypothetical protein